MQNGNLRKLLNENELSEIIGVSVQTLRNQRFKGTGLPYIKIGRRVLYDPADVAAKLDSQRVQPTK